MKRSIPLPRRAYTFFGDPRKGGRPATAEELRHLQGNQANGVPRGLSQCVICHDWNGECLDPDLRLKDLVMRVHCKCYAERCKKCGGLISSRRPNSNFYDGAGICHVPWFVAVGHTCPNERDKEGAPPCD